MTHNLLSQDQQDLHARIDKEAAVSGVQHEDGVRDRVTEPDRIWIPDKADPSWPDLDDIPRATSASLFSLIGTAFMMALVAGILPHDLAPWGMTAMFFLSVPISTIYWIRYIREERIHDALDEIEERIVELEESIIERLDVVVRNAT